jgi:hypothetical protein
MAKNHKPTASVIDVTANATMSAALAMQSSIAAYDDEVAVARGIRNGAEFRQYCLAALAGVVLGIKAKSRGARAMADAFVAAGRSKRNAETIVAAVLHRDVQALARLAGTEASDDDGRIAALARALGERDVDSVSAWKRWLAENVSRAARLAKAMEKLDGDDADEFAALAADWLAARAAKATTASGDDADDADDVAA